MSSSTGGSVADTLVCLHAHPDDEVMLTGQLLAKASAKGLRTVVIYGTRGEAGRTDHDLGEETLGERRAREALAACAELGVDRVEFLDHVDSGMAGSPTNGDPAAFSNADPDEVADRIIELLAGERVLAVVGYDANGTYGHPDHLKVHHVAVELANAMSTPWLLDATYNRDYLATLPDSDGTIDPHFASAEADLTHFVQGEEWFRAKMEGVKRHGSQERRGARARERPRRTIDGWRARFGTEWFVTRSPSGTTDLGGLTTVLEPKALWPGPLTR
jgi:LmbE family N-acetylglucosaminyl deacetylase